MKIQSRKENDLEQLSQLIKRWKNNDKNFGWGYYDIAESWELFRKENSYNIELIYYNYYPSFKKKIYFTIEMLKNITTQQILNQFL